MAEESETPAFTLIDDVRSISAIPDSGLGHTTALTHPDLRVVMLTFSAGHVLKEHRAPFPLLMQALDGELRVRMADREIRLVPGALLRLDASLPHEVEAVSASRLMLTLVTKI